MKSLLLVLIIFFLTNCSKPKTVLICGDHICLNKTEAQQYFEDNLSLEVKIIDRKEKKSFDLVELNLKENRKGRKEVKIYSKSETDKKIKVLSNKEISKLKKEIRDKSKKKKIVKKIEKIKNKKIKNNDKNSKQINLKNIEEKRKITVDVCTILKKCNIDEISKYLIKQGKNSNFPDITKRQ